MIGRPPAILPAGSVGRIRSFPPTANYSQAHFEAIGGWLPGLDKIDTLFIDSLTAISRLSFRHAEQQPEAFSANAPARRICAAPTACMAGEMVLLLNQFQHATSVEHRFRRHSGIRD